MTSSATAGGIGAADVADVARWRAADLEERLCRALDLAARALDAFGVHGFADEASPAYAFGPEKIIAESAMLAYAASDASSRPNVRRFHEALVQRLVPLARSDRAIVDMALHPVLASKFALPHILLTRMGQCDAEFDELVQLCFRSDVSSAYHRPPTAAAEYAWLGAARSGGGLSDAMDVSHARALLDAPVDVFGGLRDDAYAFTHLLFYSTDFGNLPLAETNATAGVLAMAEALLARYLDAEDYDLSGEIVQAWPLVGAEWSPSAVFTFRVLARVEDEVGILPCGNVDVNRLQSLAGDARTRYALGMAYHTAFVMGFLCAAALRSGRAPPTAIRGTTLPPAVLEQAMLRLDDAQGHWQADFERLPREEQLVLTPLILAIGLVQHCRRRDYEGVQGLLRLAEDHGLGDAPACRQASHLLTRIARCSTLLPLEAVPGTIER